MVGIINVSSFTARRLKNRSNCVGNQLTLPPAVFCTASDVLEWNHIYTNMIHVAGIGIKNVKTISIVFT